MSFDWENLKDKVIEGVAAQDIRVYIKTDLGKEVKIYDSGEPAVADEGGEGFIKYGVKIKNQNDRVIASYGDYPDTNYIKLAAIFGILGTGLFITLKGIKGTFT